MADVRSCASWSPVRRGHQMDPHHVHTRVLPSLGSRAQTAGAAIEQFVEGDARNRLLVVGTRGMGAIKRCVGGVTHDCVMRLSTSLHARQRTLPWLPKKL